MKDLGLCPVCGEPIQKYQRVYCSRECSLVGRRKHFAGENNPAWKGGRYIEPGKGYVLVRAPRHQRARQNGYVLEHILVMEKRLGRSLRDGEVVHHLNGNPADNHPENLALHSSNGEHLAQRGHHVPKAPPCDCGRPSYARGMCSRCYAYWRRTGRTRPPVNYDGRLRPLDAL